MFMKKFGLPEALGFIHVYDHYFQTSSLKLLGQEKPNISGERLQDHWSSSFHFIKSFYFYFCIPVAMCDLARNVKTTFEPHCEKTGLRGF